MKRKVKRGIKILNQLVDGVITFDAKDLLNASSPISLPHKQEDKSEDSCVGLKSYLIYLIYVYRAYGHIVLGNHDVTYLFL